MSLLGVDVGTTGCKACAFSEDGRLLASAYREYDVVRKKPGEAELDARQVWENVQQVIQSTAAACVHDPISALAVSSLGEAVVPVSHDRTILGNSILNFDERGSEYVPQFTRACPPDRLYRINGNTPGNHYTLTKLLWLRDHQPELYERTYKFLHWAGFVSFMLGADPAVDYSLANRTLLFDLEQKTWSSELFSIAGLDVEKFPPTVPSGTLIGEVSPKIAAKLCLGNKPVAVVSGAHDQCANALGCGVVEEGSAMFGMGTYFCIAPVYHTRPEPAKMLPYGLNTEHHAAPNCFVTFLYNHGGSLLKWFRETFAHDAQSLASQTGVNVYDLLMREVSSQPSSVLVLPHFAPTGPPEFVADSSGVILGLKLETPRGDIMRGIMEGVVFYLRECVDAAAAAGIQIHELRAVGGGSKSDAWLQIAADILNCPLVRMEVPEAGALGSAILAGSATGIFASAPDGSRAMTRKGHPFEPNPSLVEFYRTRYDQYRQIWPLLKPLLRELHRTIHETSD